MLTGYTLECPNEQYRFSSLFSCFTAFVTSFYVYKRHPRKIVNYIFIFHCQIPLPTKIVYLSIQLSFNVLVHTGLHAISGVYRNDSSVSARKWDERQTNIFERFIFASCESFCYSFPIKKSMNSYNFVCPFSQYVYSNVSYVYFCLALSGYTGVGWAIARDILSFFALSK